jgi:hypothetical protein
MSASIIHLPVAITQRHQVFAMNDSAAILACADLVSRHRYGVPSLALPVETREVLIEYLRELWQELDRIPTGRAS